MRRSHYDPCEPDETGFVLIEGDGTINGPIADFTQDEFELFKNHIGRIVFNIPLASRMARHRWPDGTIRDYLDIYESDDKILKAAKLFVKDLFRLPTNHLACKWRHDAFTGVQEWSNAIHDLEGVPDQKG